MPELEAQTNRAQASRILLGMADKLQVSPRELSEVFHVSEQAIKHAGMNEWDKLSDAEESRLMAEMRSYNADIEALESPFEKWVRENPEEANKWLAR